MVVVALATVTSATLAAYATVWLVPPYLALMAWIVGLPAPWRLGAGRSSSSGVPGRSRLGRGLSGGIGGLDGAPSARLDEGRGPETPRTADDSDLDGTDVAGSQDDGSFEEPDASGSSATATGTDAEASKPRRGRGRSRKAKTAEPAGPAPATWVRVGPGKFVRADVGASPDGPNPAEADPQGAAEPVEEPATIPEQVEAEGVAPDAETVAAPTDPDLADAPIPERPEEGGMVEPAADAPPLAAGVDRDPSPRVAGPEDVEAADETQDDDARERATTADAAAATAPGPTPEVEPIAAPGPEARPDDRDAVSGPEEFAGEPTTGAGMPTVVVESWAEDVTLVTVEDGAEEGDHGIAPEAPILEPSEAVAAEPIPLDSDDEDVILLPEPEAPEAFPEGFEGPRAASETSLEASGDASNATTWAGPAPTPFVDAWSAGTLTNPDKRAEPTWEADSESSDRREPGPSASGACSPTAAPRTAIAVGRWRRGRAGRPTRADLASCRRGRGPLSSGPGARANDRGRARPDSRPLPPARRSPRHSRRFHSAHRNHPPRSPPRPGGPSSVPPQTRGGDRPSRVDRRPGCFRARGSRASGFRARCRLRASPPPAGSVPRARRGRGSR